MPYPPIKILFPSKATVRGSVLGESVSDGVMLDDEFALLIGFGDIGRWYDVLSAQSVGRGQVPSRSVL